MTVIMQAHVFVSGFVQGVGFRYFVKEKAVELGLSGWVRNTPDGRVEAVFQSKSSDQEAKEDIEKMISLCRKGPFLAEVKTLDIEWEERDEPLTDFKISV